MLSPVTPKSINFTSDGTSTALVVDLSLPQYGLDLRGLGALTILTPVISSVQYGAGPSMTVAVVGTIATFTLAAPVLEYDAGVLVVYTLAFLLQW